MEIQNNKLNFERKHLENIQLILTLYRENKTISEIAKEVGLSENMVNAILKKNLEEASYQNLINVIKNNNEEVEKENTR